MGMATVLILSWLLALGCFIVGNLPLFFNFSKLRIAQLSTLGVGLLLGAALGVIIPEGVEAIYDASPDHSDPTKTIAYTLLAGFTLMLLVEQVVLPSSSSSSSSSSSNRENEYALAPNSAASFDGLPTSVASRLGGFRGSRSSGVMAKQAALKARSITFGLVVHSLADGLALGASAFSASLHASPHKDPHAHAPQGSSNHTTLHHSRLVNDKHQQPSVTDELTSNPLTLIVFLALLIHKIPTALALSTSLLSLLPPRKIRVHIGIFSIATPLGALLSFVLLGLAEAWSFAESEMEGGKGGHHSESGGEKNGLWAGIALAFSGGTFLYVATVLQPVRGGGSGHSSEGGGASGQGGNAEGTPLHQHNRSMEDLHVHPGEDEVQQLGPKSRVVLIILGMFLPIVVSSMIGHGHGHGH